MSLVFWRKTRDVGPGKPEAVAASEVNPFPVQWIQPDDADTPKVQIEQLWLPPVSGETIVRDVVVPGVGTGAAYAAGESFGTLITVHDVFRPEKLTGTLRKIVFIDMDDEGIQKDVAFFRAPVTTGTDNNAFPPTDNDIMFSEGAVSIVTFFNWNVNQVGVWDGSYSLKSNDTNLYIRLITQGADSIAAGSVPWMIFHIIPD